MALSLHHSPQWSRKLNGGGRGTWNSLALVPQPPPLDSSRVRVFPQGLSVWKSHPTTGQRGAQVDPCGWEKCSHPAELRFCHFLSPGSHQVTRATG